MQTATVTMLDSTDIIDMAIDFILDDLEMLKVKVTIL